MTTEETQSIVRLAEGIASITGPMGPEDFAFHSLAKAYLNLRKSVEEFLSKLSIDQDQFIARESTNTLTSALNGGDITPKRSRKNSPRS